MRDHRQELRSAGEEVTYQRAHRQCPQAVTVGVLQRFRDEDTCAVPGGKARVDLGVHESSLGHGVLVLGVARDSAVDLDLEALQRDIVADLGGHGSTLLGHRPICPLDDGAAHFDLCPSTPVRRMQDAGRGHDRREVPM